MRYLVLLATFCMLLWVTSSSAINHRRILINRPSTKDIFGIARNRRFASEYYGVKGYKMPTIKSRIGTPTIEHGLRKGEYMCGNRVCKLQPGDIPPGCGAMCQYPLKYPEYRP